MKQKNVLSVCKSINHLARFLFFAILLSLIQFKFLIYVGSCDLINNVLKKSWGSVPLMGGLS